MRRNSQHTDESKQKNAEAQRRNAETKRSKSSSESAVSPVIGVILMVAITVILAAVIAAFMFGMSGNITKTRIVAITAERTNTSHAAITIQGGQDMADLSGVNVTVNGDFAGSINNTQVGSRAYFPVTEGKNQIMAVGSFRNSPDQVLLDVNL